MPAPAGVDIHREMERPCRYGRSTHLPVHIRMRTNRPCLRRSRASTRRSRFRSSTSSPFLRRFPMAIFSSVASRTHGSCASGSTTSRGLCRVRSFASGGSETVDTTLKPWVGDRGFDWEISIDETPFDLWSLQGEIPPPFQSIAEKRWVAENRASSYTADEKLPAAPQFGPGVTDRQSVGVS